MTDNPSQLNNEWMQFVIGDEPWPEVVAKLATFDELDAMRTLIGMLERRIEALEGYVKELLNRRDASIGNG